MMKLSYDASGNMVSRKLENLSPPRILGQPIQQIVEPGQVATFSVVVSDAAGVTFQWKRDGVDIHDDVNTHGTTGDSVLLTTVTAANKGQYLVTVTNSAGSVTSASVALVLSTDPANNPSMLPALIAYSDGRGSVAVSPMKLSYNLGETVTLTAAPFGSNAFVTWVGDLNSGNPQASLTMDGNKKVRARFASIAPLPPGLVAFWRGETDVSDLIGGHDGRFFSGAAGAPVSVTASGKVGGAFAFDGSVHVRVQDASELRPQQFTVEAWVFPTALFSNPQSVIARGSSNEQGGAWSLGVMNDTPRFETRLFAGIGIFSGGGAMDAPFGIPVNQWTHLAASWDGTVRRLYINGVEVASQGGRGSVVYDAAEVPITIGAGFTMNAPTNFFNGSVDEAAIFDRALTTDEVSDIYNADFLGKDVTRPYFLSPSVLRDVVRGVNDTRQVLTTLGMAPRNLSLSAGTLPLGMTLSSSGTVSGVPSVSGTFRFTVRATDAVGAFAEQACMLRVV